MKLRVAKKYCFSLYLVYIKQPKHFTFFPLYIQDGSRYYQVKWFDTWIDEASLLTKCQHIVSSYWASVNQQLNQSAEVEMEETEVNCISGNGMFLLLILFFMPALRDIAMSVRMSHFK